MTDLEKDRDRWAKRYDECAATCSKLHDLNHMQAQRIEVLEAQCETRAKRIYELDQERIALCEGNKKAAEYWQKKYSELVQELPAHIKGNL